ncbi:MAG: universal stress protein [Gammaproteobacteria bacterium]|nr:universal stress protein [Gammaproteobacteria bacterium]MDJ0890806.1 universal stress protein [Gammaproteobacteria bacterium]
MKRFKSILFAADSQVELGGALDRAVALAQENDARLTVIDVVDAVPPEARMLVTAVSPRALEERLVHQRREQLEQLVGSAREDGVAVSTEVLVGPHFIEIIREVLRTGHDLVMKAAKSPGKPATRLLGATDMHLLRSCPCPVWIVKPEWRLKFKRILAAVDPAPPGDERNGLNAQILELAASLAQMEHSDLHIVHAWTLYGKGLLREEGLSKKDLKKMARKTEKTHTKWLEALVEAHVPELIKTKVHLENGKAGDVIPALATKKRVALIVMGTVGRTGIPGFFVGNTAEKVLGGVDTSVLAVKPEGFVTPVKA